MVNNRVLTPFIVEALSSLQAMKAGLNLGFRRVVVEGDALNIIKKVYRNRNKIEHAVAQEALKINENTYLEGRLPRAVGELERRNPRNVNKNKKCLKKEERLVFAK
ncbi:hypothetical protein Goshw_003363, partial [Gossypium schwendimanii]|nr:hypothetical protein [Gossypium schwendimanii]